MINRRDQEEKEPCNYYQVKTIKSRLEGIDFFFVFCFLFVLENGYVEPSFGKYRQK